MTLRSAAATSWQGGTQKTHGASDRVLYRSSDESLRMFIATHSLQGNHIIKDDETGKWWVSQVENPAFRSAIEGLYDFVGDMNADLDMAYDWVCEQADILTFVADKWAWDMFYDVWDQSKGLDD